MTPCVNWTRAKNRKGYGRQWRNGKVHQAHRLAYEDAHGTIPEGMSVLHKCDNPSCVNPEHLFLGTNTDNDKDRNEKGRQARGTALPQTRLSEETAVFAMARLLTGRETQQQIADDLCVSKGTINSLWRGTAWVYLFLDTQGQKPEGDVNRR